MTTTTDKFIEETNLTSDNCMKNALGAISAQRLDKEYNPHEVAGKRGFIPSAEFDPTEYEVRRSGKRHTDYINIMYAPKGSPLGTQHTVPKWLADAFDELLQRTKG